MKQLVTTLGPRTQEALGPGLILPHEHIFVDLRLPDHPDHGKANVEDVVALMAPELSRARDHGVVALVTCTPLGVGRRADFVRAVSRAVDFPVVAPTGVYREPWMPRWVQAASEDEVYDWMVGELEDQIEDTGVRAGWIKLSAGDDGMTVCERKVLRAAAETGAVIGSHTIRGQEVFLPKLQASGLDTTVVEQLTRLNPFNAFARSV